MANGPAGMTRARKGPTKKEIQRTYDQALDRFIRQNQDKKQEQSSVKSVIRDMPDKFQDNFAGVKNFGDMNEAQKAIFRFYDDGRSQYSRDMNRMVQKSPEFAAARTRRFPIETFIERMAPAAVGAMTGLPLGLGTLYDESRKLGSAAIGGLKAIAQKKGIIPRDDINPNTGTTSLQTDVFSPIQGPPAYDASGLAGYQDAIMKMAQQRQTPLTAYAPSMFDPTTSDFRQNMAGTEPYNPAPDVFNQESVDPLQAAKDQQDKMMQMYGPREPQGPSGLAYGFPSQFQEGGLASINNPEYNMLMKASNFDV